MEGAPATPCTMTRAPCVVQHQHPGQTQRCSFLLWAVLPMEAQGSKRGRCSLLTGCLQSFWFEIRYHTRSQALGMSCFVLTTGCCPRARYNTAQQEVRLMLLKVLMSCSEEKLRPYLKNLHSILKTW